LEAVEKLRKRKEDDALTALGEARRVLKSITDEKERLHNDLQNSLIRREKLGSIPTTPEAFQMEELFISGTRLRINRTVVQEHRATRAVERATRVYLHAKREVMVMETLREREFEEFKREVALKERKEQDDLAIMRAGRLRGEL